jgi:hypothetical protein
VKFTLNWQNKSSLYQIFNNFFLICFELCISLLLTEIFERHTLMVCLFLYMLHQSWLFIFLVFCIIIYCARLLSQGVLKEYIVLFRNRVSHRKYGERGCKWWKMVFVFSFRFIVGISSNVSFINLIKKSSINNSALS